MIRLHSEQVAATLQHIHDPDPYISCDLMDGRDAFLTMARGKHQEFSSLRRANIQHWLYYMNFIINKKTILFNIVFNL